MTETAAGRGGWSQLERENSRHSNSHFIKTLKGPNNTNLWLHLACRFLFIMYFKWMFLTSWHRYKKHEVEISGHFCELTFLLGSISLILVHDLKGRIPSIPQIFSWFSVNMNKLQSANVLVDGSKGKSSLRQLQSTLLEKREVPKGAEEGE